jgi:hypothetical protein
MNVLNIDALSYLAGLEQSTVNYLSKAMNMYQLPAHRFIATRMTHTEAAVGATKNVVFYPDKAPILEGAQDTDVFFYGDCHFSFDCTVLTDPWYVRVYSDGPLTVSPMTNAGIEYYASSVVNPIQVGEVVQVTIPRIPLTSIRVEIYGNGSITFRGFVSWTGILMMR